MFIDVGAASSLLSTLALFVSTSRSGNNNSYGNVIETGLYSRHAPTAIPSNGNGLSGRTTRTHPARPSVFPRKTTTALNSGKTLGVSNPMVPRVVQQEKYAGLLKWLESNGATINESLEIRKSSQGEQAGYGVFVNRPVKPDELLFSIPRDLCVTIEKATTSVDDDGEFGDGLKTLIEKAGPGGTTVAMAGYMAKEYILMCLEERDRREGEQSQTRQQGDDNTLSNKNRWGPYMALLPWKRGINNQEHVLFWNEAKIEELLRGSLCYSEALSLREEVSLSVRILGPLLKRSILMARGEISTNPIERLASMLPWQQYQKDDELSDLLDDKLIADAIKGAFVTLLTRSFSDDNDYEEKQEEMIAENSDDSNEGGSASAEKLVPLLDLLQHSDTPNVRHRIVFKSDDTAAVEVRARSEIDTGAELWNQYRSEEDEAMPYSRFFTRFGFVPGIDEPIENLLLDKSPIFYPQKAEV